MKQNECCLGCESGSGECLVPACPCHSPEPVESWEDFFENEFPFLKEVYRGDDVRVLADVKDFIRSLLSSQKQKQIEELEGMKWSLKRDETNEYYKIERNARNKAIDDIITKLRA